MELEEIIELAMNRSASDILTSHAILRESMRQYFGRLCGETTNDFETDLGGKSYLSCYMDKEGIIWFNIDESAKNEPEWREFDNMPTEELIYIIKEIEN